MDRRRRWSGPFFGMSFDDVASMTYLFIQNDMTGFSGPAVQADRGQRDEPRGRCRAREADRVGCHSSREE